MAQHYTRSADRKRLAHDAAQLLLAGHSPRTKNARTLGLVRARERKNAENQELRKWLVPRRGLEPPRLSPLVPETSASTNSATWAAVREIRAGISACQRRPAASAPLERIPFHSDRNTLSWSRSSRILGGLAEDAPAVAGGRLGALPPPSAGERPFAPIQRWSDLVCRLRRAISYGFGPSLRVKERRT